MASRPNLYEYNGPVSYGGSAPGSPQSNSDYVPTYGGSPPPGALPQQQPQLYYPATPAVVYTEPPQAQFYYPVNAAPAVYAAGNGWNPNGYGAQAPSGPPPPQYGAKEAGWKIPTGGDYTDTIVLSPTIRAEQASVQGPCPILWDMRRPTTSATVTNATGVNPELSQPATHPPTRSMVIICKNLPWTVTIKKYSNIRCKDVLDAVYTALQEKMTVPEYWIASPEKRKTIDAVNDRETENPRSKRKWVPTKVRGEEEKRAGDRLRIDYLDQMVLFKGLYHDPEFIEERLAHEPDSQEDAWVMALGFTSDRLA